MDGTRRSTIRPGLRVAIVLKCDQPTGKRTIGEVGQILSPGEIHPRGIKVRLKDGQVGRVQEILGPAQPKAPQIARLAVLIVEAPDGSLYARKVEIDSGATIAVLGLDSPVASTERPQEVIDSLYRKVGERHEAPRRLFTSQIEIQGRRVSLTAFACKGHSVEDEQQHQWDWTGWLSPAEIDSMSARGELSDESMILLDALHAKEHSGTS